MAKNEAKATCPRCGLQQQVVRFPASCSNCSAEIVKRRPLEPEAATPPKAVDVRAKKSAASGSKRGQK
jgi:hypothetical protein